MAKKKLFLLILRNSIIIRFLIVERPEIIIKILKKIIVSRMFYFKLFNLSIKFIFCAFNFQDNYVRWKQHSTIFFFFKILARLFYFFYKISFVFYTLQKFQIVMQHIFYVQVIQYLNLISERLEGRIYGMVYQYYVR